MWSFTRDVFTEHLPEAGITPGAAGANTGKVQHTWCGAEALGREPVVQAAGMKTARTNCHSYVVNAVGRINEGTGVNDGSVGAMCVWVGGGGG